MKTQVQTAGGPQSAPEAPDRPKKRGWWLKLKRGRALRLQVAR